MPAGCRPHSQVCASIPCPCGFGGWGFWGWGRYRDPFKPPMQAPNPHCSNLGQHHPSHLGQEFKTWCWEGPGIPPGASWVRISLGCQRGCSVLGVFSCDAPTGSAVPKAAEAGLRQAMLLFIYLSIYLWGKNTFLTSKQSLSAPCPRKGAALPRSALAALPRAKPRLAKPHRKARAPTVPPEINPRPPPEIGHGKVGQRFPAKAGSLVLVRGKRGGTRPSEPRSRGRGWSRPHPTPKKPGGGGDIGIWSGFAGPFTLWKNGEISPILVKPGKNQEGKVKTRGASRGVSDPNPVKPRCGRSRAGGRGSSLKSHSCSELGGFGDLWWVKNTQKRHKNGRSDGFGPLLVTLVLPRPASGAPVSPHQRDFGYIVPWGVLPSH